MVIVMRPDATKEQIQQVARMVREAGLKDHVIEGTDLTVVAVIGDDRKKDIGMFEHGIAHMTVQVEFGTHGRRRAHNGAHSRQQVTFAVVVAIGDHGPMQEQQYGVDSASALQIGE
ncbi:MAG: hypothetical protein HC809_17200 [Gammaproteobacteria bacterium]|nr:hypothetical protein [Gammaproteobacteria bacterium]